MAMSAAATLREQVRRGPDGARTAIQDVRVDHARRHVTRPGSTDAIISTKPSSSAPFVTLYARRASRSPQGTIPSATRDREADLIPAVARDDRIAVVHEPAGRGPSGAACRAASRAGASPTRPG